MRKAAPVLFAAIGLLFMAGCRLQFLGTTSPSGTTAPVGLTVTDTPPAGVVVLFFQLSVTGASLAPGNVSLLSSTNPIPANVSQLQTEAAFVSSADVAAGTYTSLSLTLSNPQLTIYNGTGSAIGTCANNTICQLTPTTTPLTLAFSSAPFPITLAANSPLALMLDIHLNTVIQPDLTVNLAATNGVTLSQMPSPPAGQLISGLGNLIGTVQTVGMNQFTLQTADGRTFTIYVNSSTTYDLPSGLCSLEAFSCLATGQGVKVAVSLQSDATLLATEVDYLQAAGQQAVEGTIVGLSASSDGMVMDLILQAVPPTSMSNALPLGAHASVTVPASGVTYVVDWGSFTPPSDSNLGPFVVLLVGQEVRVVVQGPVTSSTGSGTSSTSSSTPVGPAPISFTTNSITLEPTQITGQISSIDASGLDFPITTFPSFFIPTELPWGPPTLSPGWITVDTTTQTTYEGLSQNNFSGLAANDLVSVEGWLLPYLGPVPAYVCTKPCPVQTTMAAKAVRGRPNQLF